MLTNVKPKDCLTSCEQPAMAKISNFVLTSEGFKIPDSRQETNL